MKIFETLKSKKDVFCLNKVPALEITINIDETVLKDLIASDIVPK